jgi:hypothetical protein
MGGPPEPPASDGELGSGAGSYAQASTADSTGDPCDQESEAEPHELNRLDFEENPEARQGRSRRTREAAYGPSGQTHLADARS